MTAIIGILTIATAAWSNIKSIKIGLMIIAGGDYIRYYARVKNRGEYKAEPAIIQSSLIQIT